MSQGGRKNRGSLIGLPLALRVTKDFFCDPDTKGKSAGLGPFSLRSCRSSSVIFFDFWEGNLAGILWAFFGSTKLRLKNVGENFGAFFVGEFVPPKNIFRANFVLQTCHPLGVEKNDPDSVLAPL